jgi:phosphoglycerate dehydrogenase-like enzyme
MTDGPNITVGLFYRVDQLRQTDAWNLARTRIEAIDPGITVVGEDYLEPHALRVLRQEDTRESDLATLRKQAPALTAAQAAAFAAADIAVTVDLPFDIRAHAPRLRWVQSVSAGVGHLLSCGLRDSGVRLTTGAGANAVGIAEFAVARILQHWKIFRTFDELQSRRQWGHVTGRELAGSTIGLIGLGAINTAVAARLRAFGVRLLATRRSASAGERPPNIDQMFDGRDLHAMLAECDAVVAAVPGSPETQDMINPTALAAMKAGAFFVNVGRGSLVDEAALREALRLGHLSGAALDVTVHEPLSPEDPLWDAPNLYLSPHAATARDSLWPNVLNLFCDNLERYLAGKPLINEVDLGPRD